MLACCCGLSKLKATSQGLQGVLQTRPISIRATPQLCPTFTPVQRAKFRVLSTEALLRCRCSSAWSPLRISAWLSKGKGVVTLQRIKFSQGLGARPKPRPQVTPPDWCSVALLKRNGSIPQGTTKKCSGRLRPRLHHGPHQSILAPTKTATHNMDQDKMISTVSDAEVVEILQALQILCKSEGVVVGTPSFVELANWRSHSG